MKKSLKILLASLVVFFFICSCSCNPINDDYRELIETNCGDSFSILFDSFKVKTIVEDNNSRFHVTLKGKITKDDIELLSDSDGIKLYRFKYLAVYDIGEGLATFHGVEDTDASIVSIIRDFLLSDDAFFEYNIEYFLDNSKYDIETQQIIEAICNGDYTQLQKYGLTDSIVNNSEKIESIKQEALEIKSTRNICG